MANRDYTSRGCFAPYDAGFRPRNINLVNDRTFVPEELGTGRLGTGVTAALDTVGDNALTGQPITASEVSAVTIGTVAGTELGNYAVAGIRAKNAAFIDEQKGLADKMAAGTLHYLHEDDQSLTRYGQGSHSFARASYASHMTHAAHATQASSRGDAAAPFERHHQEEKAAAQVPSARSRHNRFFASSQPREQKTAYYNRETRGKWDGFMEDVSTFNRQVERTTGSIVRGINTVGEWVANTPIVRGINAFNPILIGAELLNEADDLWRAGNTRVATATAGLAVVSMLPGEGSVVGVGEYAGAIAQRGIGFFARTAEDVRGFAKISSANYVSEVNQYTSAQLGKIISDNPIASKSYAQLQKYGTEVRLDHSIRPESQYLGISNGDTNLVKIYVRNNRNANEIASTLVHESSHINRYFRGFRESTQYEEYLAFRREFLFNAGTRPTLLQRQEIWNHVQELYSHLPEYRPPVNGW